MAKKDAEEDHDNDCPTCNGTGQGWDADRNCPKKCDTCGGTGSK
jgi:hypothetical protein